MTSKDNIERKYGSDRDAAAFVLGYDDDRTRLRLRDYARKDKKGNIVPRKIINKFECKLNGATVFTCDIEPAISANPYVEFTAKVEEAGEFEFIWTDDDGSVYSKKSPIKVS